jgi:hemoglobin
MNGSKIRTKLGLFLMMAAVSLLAGCGGAKAQTQNRDFFTSGSREADQRASQRMAKDEQLAGTGEGAGEKGVKKAVAVKHSTTLTPTGATNRAAQAEGKLALFDRLGSEGGISNIVADFVPRVLDDPRVNWERKGITRGGLSLHRNKPVTWHATPSNVDQLKTHLIQFIALATGGPARYDGPDMRSSHANLHISNAEFDAAIGDLKASLDRLQIPNKEQKELLAIVESTRPEIVEER